MHTFILFMLQKVSQDNFNAAISFSVDGDCQDLLNNHTLLWNFIWSEGQMDINYEKPSAEHLHLRKVLLSSQYYIYSNLPSPLTYRPNNPFFGLSPGGLSTGKFESYQNSAAEDLVTTDIYFDVRSI